MEMLVVVLLVMGYRGIRGGFWWEQISYLHLGLFSMVCFLVALYTWGWKQFISWEVVHGGVWNLSALFASWAWNDLSFSQGMFPAWVTKVLRFCYAGGYLAMLVVPALPCFLRGSFLQGWRYVFSGHLLQSLLILPFLVLFSVQEVWWVKHVPDGLYRVFVDDMEMLKSSYNCFPSMHTSMAAAMAIVGWKDQDKYFRWGWGVYCGLVIVSTVYFPVHWAIDVVAGVVLGVISAKIGCYLAEKVTRFIEVSYWDIKKKSFLKKEKTSIVNGIKWEYF